MWYNCLICLVEGYDFEAKCFTAWKSSNKMRGHRTWPNGTARCFRPDDNDNDLTSLFIVI
jgi:hypothetical protein